ncbi:MAG TPA: hypothetical protein VHB77_06045 [Planctomycetaceae bacterium]|nr:hypothetical protein [Planctomycetaceae bacterium]
MQSPEQPAASTSPVSRAAPRRALPEVLRLLCVGAVEPAWVNLVLQLDACGCTGPRIQWVSTSAEALVHLRNSGFDAVLIQVDENLRAAGCDPHALLSAMRADGNDDPVLLITDRADDDLWALACENSAEVLVSPRGIESRAMATMLASALERADALREARRIATADRRRLDRERDEASQLLDQQRQMIRQFDAGDPGTSVDAADATTGQSALPVDLNEHYQELLRTYVIMGSGSLVAEIARMAEVLARVDYTPRQTLQLHVERVEQLVKGLGNRSTRHVMGRADLLALELMVHLGECYQRRSAGRA